MKLKDAMILALEKDKAGKKLKIMSEQYIDAQLRKNHSDNFYYVFDDAFGLLYLELKELSGAINNVR